MRTPVFASLAVALLAVGCAPPGASRRAESVPIELLPIAADTVSLPWPSIPEAAWLGGRKWVVVGADQEAAIIVDFGTGTTLALVGVGGSKPFGVYSIGDTAFIADWGKRQIGLWSTDGRLVDSIQAPAATRGVLPKARDAAGQHYFEVPPPAGPDGGGLRDSAALVRSDAAMTRFDTVARLAPLDVAVVSEARGSRYERLVFSGNDWWGVHPNGRVWIARVRRNEVSVMAGTKERRGDRLPDPVLEVSRADREQYVAGFPVDLRPMVEKLQYAPFHPPFTRAFDGAGGFIWLRKSKTALDSVRRYHVVDTAGTLVRVFSAYGPGLIVAAGDQAALMAEQFKDGIRLMEIRLPAPPPIP